MRRKRSPFALLVILLVGIFVSAVVSSPALATGPKKGVSISGAISLAQGDNVSQPPVQQGAIQVIKAEARVTFTGSMRGPAVEPYTSVLMPDDGPILQFGTGTFTGKILGRKGTVTYVFSGDAANGGLITITGGTGQLHGTSGRLWFYPTSGSTADPVTFHYDGLVTLRNE
jgi:hypothetical protein